MAWRFPLMGRLVLLAVVGIIAAEFGQARAQTLDEGWSKLDAKYKGVGPRVRGFFRGQETVDPSDKGHLEAIDLAAKNYTYGVYLRKLETQPSGIKKDFEEFEGEVNRILKSKSPDAVKPLAEVLSKQIGIHALEVIQLKGALPIHKLHNARVLAKTAELGKAPLADPLVTVLKDPQQNDGVHYYALKGLAELLPLMQPPQQATYATALVEFLEQKKGPDKNASIEEIDGFRILRREAIRALAKTHTPAINDKVRPALVLARFAGNDSRIQPPPRIDERIEAANGLARMQAPPKDNQYQADYAAGQIAKCLGAMAQLADKERANRDSRLHPWRILAAQLKDTLAALKKNNEKNNYVVQIVDKGSKLLDRVINGAEISPNDQTWWSSQQSDPPSKQLFQGSADSNVTPAPPTEPDK